MGRDIVIGRSSDLDMVLVEDMVSRKHAKISTHNGQVVIQDLGSTNGTFVNGEKIKKVRLKEGDRILIGTSIIKLITATGDAAGAQNMMSMPAPAMTPRRTITGGGRSMQGTIDEIPLPDLMQLLSTSKKSGVLEIQSDQGLGRIYMDNGRIYYATINEAFEVNPRKSLFRMLVWESGTFVLEPPDDKEFLEQLDDPTEALLMEAMRQLDTIRHMEGELPARSAYLALANPITSPLRELSPKQLDVLQQVHNHGMVSVVLDKSPLTDLETFEELLALIKQEFISVKN
jgi:hypothetical protein